MTGLHDLDVFQGETTHQSAQVYVRLPRRVSDDSLKLQGCVVGPESLYGATLPAKFPLRDLGPGETVLAKTAVTDPCFWSPKTPSLYRIELRLQRGEQTVAIENRVFGLRNFGIDGQDLRMDGKRWVLRGIHVESGEEVDWNQCREAGTAILLRDPSNDTLQEASRRGVMALAYIDGSHDEMSRQLRRLGRWPALTMAILRDDAPVDRTMRQVAPNILFARQLPSRGQEPSGGQGENDQWADLVIADASERESLVQTRNALSIPVIALRPLVRGTPMERRAGCDHLQRDLAPNADYAGFIV